MTSLARWEPLRIDLPATWRRWFDMEAESEGWLRVEELHENGDLVIRAECPGIDPDKDVKVSISEGVLHIDARREERSEDKSQGRGRTEFRYGRFSRNVVLPRGLDETAVTAQYKDGILEVRVPWPEEQKSATTTVPVTRT